jgi:hypothetical protein
MSCTYHEIVRRTGLMLQSLYYPLVVCCVAGVVPVIYEGVEHGAAFPPVVRCRKITGSVAGSVSGVVARKSLNNRLCGTCDGAVVGDCEIDSAGQLGYGQRTRGLREEAHAHVYAAGDAILPGRRLLGKIKLVGSAVIAWCRERDARMERMEEGTEAGEAFRRRNSAAAVADVEKRLKWKRPKVKRSARAVEPIATCHWPAPLAANQSRNHLLSVIRVRQARTIR